MVCRHRLCQKLPTHCKKFNSGKLSLIPPANHYYISKIGMKRIIILCCIVIIVCCSLTGCISGEIAEANDYLSNVSVLRYVSAEQSDGEIIWNGSNYDEDGNPLPVPTVEEMMSSTMRMDNYMKIQFSITGDSNKAITAIKFNVVSDRAGTIRLVVRDNLDLAREPLFAKVFNLNENEGAGFILAGLELTTQSECLYIGNEPETQDIKDYDGYKMKWKIKDLEIVIAA